MFRAPLTAAMILALVPGVAHAAPQPVPLKIVTTTKLRGADHLDTVVATSKGSAFAFGVRNGRSQQPIAYRWDGKAWRDSKLPKGLTGFVAQASASSAGNVWAALPGNQKIFDDLGEPADCEDTAMRRRAEAGDGPSRLLRWDGKRWTTTTFKDAYIDGVTTTSANNAWAFGADKAGPAAWHFNGKHWTRTATPFVILRPKASSAKNIWGVGYDLKTWRIQLVRLEGKVWKAIRRTGLPKDVSPTKDVAGRLTFFNSVLPGPGKQLWATSMTLKGKACSLDSDMKVNLHHWNGRAWASETPKTFGGALVGQPAHDGRGGIYLAGTDFKGSSSLIFHRTAGGTWTRSKGKSNKPRWVLDMAHIPGTTSVWAVGQIESAHDDDGFIAQVGE